MFLGSILMHAVLFLCLLMSAGEPDEPQQVQEWSEQIAAAYEQREAGNFDESLRLYSQLLESIDGPPEGAQLGDIDTWPAEWIWKQTVLWERGVTRLEAGQPQLAIEDFEEYQRSFGSEFNPGLLEQVAQACDALGDHERADELRRQIADIQQRAYGPWEPEAPGPVTRLLRRWVGPSGEGPSSVGKIIAACLVTLLTAGILTLINVLIGRRQKREGGGTWRRLLWVAAAVAGLQTLPLLVGLIAACVLDDSLQRADAGDDAVRVRLQRADALYGDEAAGSFPEHAGGPAAGG